MYPVEQYRFMFESNPHPMWVYDLETLSFLEVNDAAIQHYGYSRDEFLSMTIKDIRPPEDIPDLLENISKVTTGLDVAGVWRHKRKDGSIIYVEIVSHTLIFEGRRSEVVLANDITKRLKTEEAICRSENIYRTLFETMVQGVVYQDADGKIISANPAAKKILGLTLNETISRTSMDPRWKAIHEDGSDFPGDTHPAMVALRTGKEVRDVVMGIFNPVDKKYRWININAEPQFRPGKDKPYQVYTIFDDITERRQAEENIKKEKEYTVNLLNSMKEGLAVVDEEGKQILVNDALCEMTGYSKEEFLNKYPPFDYWAEEGMEDTNKAFERTLKGIEDEYELIFKKKNGERFIARVTPRKITDPEGKSIFLATFKDITEHKRAEKALIKERDKAQKYLDIAGVILTVIDTNGKVTLINKKGCEILGFKEEEIIGKDWFDNFIPEKNREEMRKVFKKLISGDTQLVEYYENPVITGYGEERIIAWHNSVLTDDTGNITCTLSSGEDITERRKTEEELVGVKVLLEKTFDSLDQAVFVVESKTRKIIACNPAVKHIFGYSEKEVIGKNTDFLHVDRDMYERFGGELFHALDTKGVYNTEYQMRRKNGSIFSSEHTVKEIVDESGNRTNVVSVVRDITERKKAEQALIESEKKYRDLFENANDSICIVNSNFKFKDVNKKIEELSGYSKEELLKMSILDIIPEEQVPRSEIEFEKLRKKGSYEKFRGKIRTKNGANIDVEVSSSAIIENGKITGSRDIIRDITERKKIEEALRESEAKFRATFEDAAIGIAQLDMEGKIVDCNPALEKILGFTKEEIRHTLFTEITHPDYVKADWNLFMELIEGKRNYYQMEKRYYRKDNTLIWGRLTVSVVRDALGEPQFAIRMLEDITEQKQADEELKIKAQLLDAATDSIFVHDLEGNFVYLNEAAYRSRGFDKDEMMKMNIQDVVTSDYSKLVKKRIKEVAEKGEAVFESNHTRKNGSIIPVEVHSRIVESGGKKLILSVNRDITERKQAEKMLKERARAQIYAFLVSALPVFTSGVPPQVRDTLVATFAERFEKNIRPRFEEIMRQLGDGKDIRKKEKPEKVLGYFILWLSELFSNLGIQTRTSYLGTRGSIKFMNCPWVGEARGNPIFCLICRTIVVRSFEWTLLKGSAIQKSSIAGGSDTCKFEVILFPVLNDEGG